jgi:putative selenium metabolism hydrolase
MTEDATRVLEAIFEMVERRRGEAASFLQDLIRTPSPSGHEEEAARVLSERMRALGFDEVEVDGLHDVMATIRGTGGGRSLLLNGHIDHVPAGDMADPYSGRLLDGGAFGVDGLVVYGRGASDMKGTVAAMAMAGGILSELGVELEGDFKVAVVAQEEVDGAGTKATIEEGKFLGDVVIVGEATNMDVALGHRGGARADIVVRGRSCHASAPERGVNALYKAADLMARIRASLIPRLPDHPIFGKTTIAVTRISAKPDIANVVPGECRFHIDCRNTPDFPTEALRSSLEEIIGSMRDEDQEMDAFVLSPSPTGVSRGFTGFYTDPEEYPVVAEARSAIADVLGHEPKLKTWRFATDGRFYSWLGIPVLGFGPGEERFAHTHEDHVRVEDYLDSVKAYAWLACKICGVK